jgi:PAS domain S-box-containing protein
MSETNSVPKAKTAGKPIHCTIFTHDPGIISRDQLMNALWEAAEEYTLDEVQRDQIVLNMCMSQRELIFVNRFSDANGCISSASLRVHMLQGAQPGEHIIYGFVEDNAATASQPPAPAVAISYLAPFDETLQPISISRQIETLLGFPIINWMHNANFWYEHLHPADREAVMQQRQQCYHTEQPFCSEYRMLTREGQSIWIREEATPMLNGCDYPQYMQGTLLDITRRKHYEDHVQQRQQPAAVTRANTLRQRVVGL